MKDSIQTITDSSEIIITSNNLETIGNNGFDLWFIISMIQVLIIIVLLYKNQKLIKTNLKDDKFSELKNAKKADINMGSLMENINLSKDLYKKLSRSCHPDRFQDEQIKNKADKIFQEISKNQRNYQKLVELKSKAEQELNINLN